MRGDSDSSAACARPGESWAGSRRGPERTGCGGDPARTFGRRLSGARRDPVRPRLELEVEPEGCRNNPGLRVTQAQATHRAAWSRCPGPGMQPARLVFRRRGSRIRPGLQVIKFGGVGNANSGFKAATPSQRLPGRRSDSNSGPPPPRAVSGCGASVLL